MTINWFTGQPQPAASTTNGHVPAPTAPHEEDTTAHTPEANGHDASDVAEETHIQEEELDSGGWGGDDFGML